MRILHVTPYYEQAWGYGGVPRVVGALARAQVRAGHRVSVCTTDARDAAGRLAGQSTTDPGHGGVEVHVFPNLSNRAAHRLQLFAPRGLRGWLAANAVGFDVVHVHACHHLPGVWAERACEGRQVAYLLSPHGTGPRIERRRAAKWCFDVVLGRKVLPRARQVLCVSDSERADLRRLGVDPARLTVVGNPLEPGVEVAAAAKAAFRARHHLGEAPVVAFLGRITPRKGVDTLLEAFARLGDERARLVVAGNAPGLEGQLSRQARELGLGNRMLRLGQLEGPTRLEVLAAADVVAYPARQEVFGLVAFEALLCGTPVVVAGDSGCGELVAELGGGVLVPPGDPASLALALRRVLEAPESFRAAAAIAGKQARERFSPEAVAARVGAAYAKLAGPGAR